MIGLKDNILGEFEK